MAQKSERSYEYFNGEKEKNLIRIHYRLTNLVRRFTRGRRRCRGIWGGGGGLSFRDSVVVPFTFDLDFPEGLSCRESTVDESGGKTVPYRPWKWRILERVRGRRRRRENWYGKRGGGRVTQRFSCQQHYGPSTKKLVRERDLGEGVKKKVVEQSYAQNK